jgi:putative salt-induced outer membrane protein YdiY
VFTGLESTVLSLVCLLLTAENPTVPVAAGESSLPAAATRASAPALVDDADEVDAITPQNKDKKEPKDFSGTATAGASASAGNTNVRTANINVSAEYKLSEKDRISGLFDFLYNDEKDQTTKVRSVQQRRTRGAAQYDRFFQEDLYGFARLDATGDSKQGLQLRLIGSLGAGYQFWSTDETKFAAEAGVAYTHEDYKGQTADGYAALRSAAKYFRAITEDLKFNGGLEWLPGLEDWDDQLALGFAQLDYNLGRGFVTTLRYEFDWDNTPRPGNDRTDHRLIWGLGFTL